MAGTNPIVEMTDLNYAFGSVYGNVCDHDSAPQIYIIYILPSCGYRIGFSIMPIGFLKP